MGTLGLLLAFNQTSMLVKKYGLFTSCFGQGAWQMSMTTPG